MAPVSEAALIARVAACVIAVAATCVWGTDPDLWGHLRFGLDIIRDGELPATDPYSFTSDVRWINHEWLSEVALAAAYTAAGIAGLLLLKTVVLGGAFLIMGHRLRYVSSPARWWFLAVAATVLWPVVSTWRPQLWTVLLLTILTATVHKRIRHRAIGWPVLFGAWSNLHGGWIVGLGVLAARAVGTALDAYILLPRPARRDPRGQRRAIGEIAVLAVCALATLATPYGLDLWGFIWSTVGLDRDITEWRPLLETSSSSLVLWSTCAIVTLLCLWKANWTWGDATPVLMLALASTRVTRLMPLFGITAVMLLSTQWRRSDPERLPWPLLAFVSLACLVPITWLAATQLKCLPIRGSSAPDLRAAGALHTPEIAGRLMVPFDWGQYAIWHFAPRLRVSFDGRRETVYSPARLREMRALDDGNPAIIEFIERDRPEYVWLYWPRGSEIARSLAARGYRRDLTTKESAILVRDDLPALRERSPMSACFP